MATATLTFYELDREASSLEAKSKTVRVALVEGSVWAVLFVGCAYLHRARRTANKLRVRISTANVRTAEQRTIMREVSHELAQAATAISEGLEQFRKINISRFPMVGPHYLSLLEDLVCMAEDMSETAALAGSSAFARSVRKDVRVCIDDHHKRQAKTA